MRFTVSKIIFLLSNLIFATAIFSDNISLEPISFKDTPRGELGVFEIIWAPDNEKLVINDATRTWLVKIGSGEVILLTEPMGPDPGATSVIWSPDSKRILFQGFDLKKTGQYDGNLWIIDLDNFQKIKITSDNVSFDKKSNRFIYKLIPLKWSGNKIIYPSKEGIGAIDIDERIETNIAIIEYKEPYARFVSISPDGRKVVYVFGSSRNYITSVRVINIHNLEVKDITPFAGKDRDIYFFHFSPDGTKIAFLPRVREKKEIKVIDLNKMSLETINPGLEGSIGNIQWSVDNKKIFFTTWIRKTSEYSFSSGIWVINIDGSELKQVIEPPVEDWSISPDGKKIAFTKEVRAKELWIATLEE